MTTAKRDGSGPAALEVLVVDDAPRIRSTLSLCLEEDGHRVESARTWDEALHAARRRPFDAAFVDIRLGDRSGLDLIPELLDQLPWLKVLVITAHATVESAVEAMKRGAVDYLQKPFSTTEVRLAVRKIAEVRNLEERVANLEEMVEESAPSALLQSADPEMTRVLETAREVAPTDATVLLRGESGTGKGVLARAIHAWSPRAEAPFGVAHCPSFNADLLESELFGHMQGAFTGAVRSNPGRVSRCGGGSLLLDEIGELPPTIQPKLLRFVQSREYERVGDPEPRTADVRLIASTNRSLEKAVQEGRFREDLYYRLNVIELTIPPLRRRSDDILTLAHRFLAFYSRKHDRRSPGFTPEAERALEAHSWPGNVRELENAVERAVILSRSKPIGPGLLPFAEVSGSAPPRIGEPVTIKEVEAEHIRRVVARCETLEEAAEILGIDSTTLWRRRKRHDI